MYDDGIDIIFAAAGGSGAGVFKAAKATGNLGIGVDSDQYNSPTLADVKDVIMTSMLKKVDVATYDFITSAVNGELLTGEHKYDLTNDGVGYATSGGQVDDIVTAAGCSGRRRSSTARSPFPRRPADRVLHQS